MDKTRVAIRLPILIISISIVLSSIGSPAETDEIKDIQWSMGPTLRYGLKFVAQAILGDQILIAGGSQAPGCGPDNATDRVWFFNPATQAYENLPNAPKTLAKGLGVAVGQDFYLLGGVLCAEKYPKEGVFTREVWRLSKRNGNWRWETMPPLPYYRAFSGVVSVGTQIVVLGGRAVYQPQNPQAMSYTQNHWGVEIASVQAFDTAAPEKGWYDLPPIPRAPRSAAAILAIGRKIYLFGGWYYKTWLTSPNSFVNCMDAYVLDLDSLNWRQLPNLPFPVRGLTATAYGSHSIILLNGYKGGPVEEGGQEKRLTEQQNWETLVYDIDLEYYRVLPSKLPNQGVTEAGRRDFARMKAKHHPDDWVHHFDFSQGLSQNAPPLLLGNRLYIMGGASNNYAPSNASAEVIVGTIVK